LTEKNLPIVETLVNDITQKWDSIKFLTFVSCSRTHILCKMRLLTVTLIFITVGYHSTLDYNSRLKTLISFTNFFLHSHSYSFRTAFTDLEHDTVLN